MCGDNRISYLEHVLSPRVSNSSGQINNTEHYNRRHRLEIGGHSVMLMFIGPCIIAIVDE
jgi:hypothetical protein